ncbi:MAG TPA: protein-arginine deiminase family protein [Verrucomicrobiae bacterium]|nr:protein-arginine deiminase family protein [Verrucomicrobiae bacterium]
MKTATSLFLLSRILAMSSLLTGLVHLLTSANTLELHLNAGRAKARIESLSTAEPEPPVISGSGGSQSAEVPEGNNIVFRVVLTGTPPFSYQWQFNGVAVPGATDADFLLPNVQTSQSGAYSVLISNSAGSAQSAITYLTVVSANPGGTGSQTGAIQFTQAQFDMVESLGSVSIDLIRSGNINSAASVLWSVQGGTATPGLDYTISSSTLLTFESGEVQKSIIVQLLDNDLVEPTRTISFALHDPTNAVLGEISSTTLNILDDDTGDTIARPPLHAYATGGSLVLTWPSGPYSFCVQTTTALTATATWGLCNYPIQTAGSQNQVNQVIIPTSGEQSVFFRLAPAPPPADVDIDVDTNRNGEVENDADEEDEDKPVKYLNDFGALVLVNCNADRKDRKAGDGLRDMDDRLISGAEDEADMSPISLELKRDLAQDEILLLSIFALDDNGKPDKSLPVPIRFMDKMTGRALFGDGNGSRLDDFPLADGKKLFPGGKKIRYDGRFLLEGLRFATEVEIKLFIYNKRTKATSALDVVRVATTPWLANHHLQALVDPKACGISGNMVNSTSYPFSQGYGSTLVKAGGEFEFVQDGVEWGYQCRRQNPAEKSRTMIVALRLYTEREDKHPLLFAGPKVGIYGWSPTDEKYFENTGARKAGDQGGNLECLPPTDKFPFGRIIYGDFMSARLKAFLTRQAVQMGVELKLDQLDLPHVDEMIVVVPKKEGWVVILPDWDAGRAILAANKNLENPPSRIQIDGQFGLEALATYAKILDYIDNQAAGKKFADKYRTGIAGIEKQLKAEGVQLLRLPGMFFVTGGPAGADIRGWPRNIANCQVSNPKVGDPGTLIVSMPPDLDKNVPDPFLTAWKAIFQKEQITIGLEDMSTAWQRGGEAHCSSNGIREPMKK